MIIPNLTAGLEFKSTTFSATAKIVSVRESENEIDVELTPSDGFAWVEKGWNLQHTQWAFEEKIYELKKLDQFNITVL